MGMLEDVGWSLPPSGAKRLAYTKQLVDQAGSSQGPSSPGRQIAGVGGAAGGRAQGQVGSTGKGMLPGHAKGEFQVFRPHLPSDLYAFDQVCLISSLLFSLLVRGPSGPR